MSPEQEIKLNQIYDALIGNPSLGQEGIIPRISKLEHYRDTDEKIKSKVAGMVFIGTPVIGGIWAFIWNKLSGQ